MVPDSRHRPLSVLVIDDYPDAASSLAMVLAIEGFATRTAGSCAEALASLRTERSDVVVLEPRTVGCGWAFAGRMTDPAISRRPLLVVYTTDTSAAGRSAAQVAGVGSYLIKPEDPTVLTGLLREYQQSTGEDNTPLWRPPEILTQTFPIPRQASATPLVNLSVSG